jgi:aspartyl-tRNA(Asn)/glutamyl-tRNA(Gln) amidotransferase subunit C
MCHCANCLIRIIEGLSHMSISRKEVEHVALLARMRLTEAEITELTSQLSNILDHISVLQEADVTDIPPLPSLLSPGGVMRNDVVAPSYSPAELLANAPEREDDYARVKAVLE